MCHKVAFLDQSRADVLPVKEINPRILSNPLVVTGNVCKGLRGAVVHHTASPASKLMHQHMRSHGIDTYSFHIHNSSCVLSIT